MNELERARYPDNWQDGFAFCNPFESTVQSHLQVNRDGEPMRASKFQFEILPGRLKLHLPGTKLLSKHKGKGSPEGKSDSKPHSRPRGLTSPQASFLQRVQSMSRPHFEDKGRQKVKGVAASAAKMGLVFGAGGVAGIIAQRRGWLGGRH